jgi:hypothetical protein
MISLFFELVEWMIKLMVIACVLIAKAVVWTYRAIDQLVHEHRLAKNPQADRATSQLIAGGSVAALLGVLALIGSATGGSGASAGGPGEPDAAMAATYTARIAHHKKRSSSAHARKVRERRQRVTALRAHRARLAAARRAKAARAHRARLAAARRAKAARAHRARLAAARQAAAAPSCNENYSGCLNPNASDYDCAGGSGDGPEYTGPVNVTGYDEFDLDRDGDGVACDT